MNLFSIARYAVNRPHTVEDIAKVLHEANRALCSTFGDESQLAWEVCPAWQKTSAIKGVEAFLQNPGMTPEETHEAWLETKTRDGWTYGPIKDATKKTHPSCLPFNELPIQEKTKDVLFVAVCKALTPLLRT